jgi:hypothetical protein
LKKEQNIILRYFKVYDDHTGRDWDEETFFEILKVERGESKDLFLIRNWFSDSLKNTLTL